MIDYNIIKQNLVAHRGNSDQYPENSLEAFQSAIDAGAKYLETDVQISKDNVVVLSHDASLKKITGHDVLVAESFFKDIKHLSASYEERFDHKYTNLRLGTLNQLCDLIKLHPDVKLFVEIKSECVDSHGEKALGLILSLLNTVKDQVVIISFHYGVLKQAKEVTSIPLGWIIPEDFNVDMIKNDQLCQQLNPNYVFCDTDFLPHKHSIVWAGDWSLAIYTIHNIYDYKHYAQLGFNLFETNNISQHLPLLGDVDEL